MKKLKTLLLCLLVSAFAISGAFAQEDDEKQGDEKYANYPKRGHDQLDKYLDGDSYFPPKPKSQWSIGLKGGLAFIQGDVPSRNGFAGAFDIRKAMGHSFSLRLQGNYAKYHGLEFRPRGGFRFASAANNPWKAAGYTGQIFENFETRTIDVTLQAVMNLNNINFYKEQVKWNMYIAVGVGMIAHNVKVDALKTDSSSLHDFRDVVSQLPANATFKEFKTAKSETWKNIETEIGDFDYESNGEGYTQGKGINLSDDYFLVDPVFTAALGLRYRLGKRFDIEAEYRVGLTFRDVLDNVRWTEQGSLSPNWDNLNQVTLGINYRIGKGENSAWWENPLKESYKAAAESRKLVKNMTDDGDDDGVPDLYDKEPDTPEDTPVDAAGRTLDSDGDGVSDKDDDQPFSPKNAAVDERGVATDADSDGIPDIFDKDPNSPAGALVDAQGRTIAIVTEDRIREIIRTEGGSGECLLPMIHFDLDRDVIKPEFYPELFYVAQMMKANPSYTVVAVGYTDVRADDNYNLDLSQRRVDAAVDFLVNTYGIDRSRFETSFEGESNNIIPELPDNRSQRKLERFHYINRRVEFKCQK